MSDSAAPTDPRATERLTEKGWPDGWPQRPWNLLDGQALWPLVVLKKSALESNIAAMASYCRRYNVDLAPHAKTTMSPELFRRQLGSGAWGLTAATPWQVKTIRTLIETPVLLANVLVDDSGVRYIVRELNEDRNFIFLCYIDSMRGLSVVSELLDEFTPERPLRVLIEVGYANGRTGCRSLPEALKLADAINATPTIELAGVAGFEGLIPSASATNTDPVDAFLLDLRKLICALDRKGSFSHLSEVVVSAGGSAYFDRVVEHLTRIPITVPTRTIMRSGCYVTHDAEMYEELSPLAGRRAASETLRLDPALELWSTVLSRPEPNLAIAGFGKRDASFDYRLPVPLRHYRRRSSAARDMTKQASVSSLNDQHAFLSLDSKVDMYPGDLIVCGLSHPCTVFDKWKAIPVVNEAFDVVDVVHTYF